MTRFFLSLLAGALLLAGTLPHAVAQRRMAQPGVPDAPNVPDAVEQLFAMANQSRAQAGARPLHMDAALSAAALTHCQRMAAAHSISHRYPDEADLDARTAQAGAHFSLIEENVAAGPTASAIHSGWMHSTGHRLNLLNPAVDHVGIAVVESDGMLYAVADYEHAVAAVAGNEADDKVASLLEHLGVKTNTATAAARAACRSEHGIPVQPEGSAGATFVMRWQTPDLSQLPQPLRQKIAQSRYRHADVASCPAQNDEGGFTVYRLAVLLH